ncbi:DUF4116 domain-containing protein [Endozoicomonas sp. ONNA1]|uniref:DUF4116 domain-containing protein n=1 Tax=Endozoicomonas sp. ONNA1 TaxID=2828740 RepID=UPI00214834D1|nr:DUF4116 domain-containing protein [Endozoicomonas sp. ONNA1]
MLPTRSEKLDYQPRTIHLDKNTGADLSPKRYLSCLETSGFSNDPRLLAKRSCRLNSPPIREQLGGKGMFLRRMQASGLPVPPFQCVTAQVMHDLEQHPLDIRCLAPYLPEVATGSAAESSLTNIREYLNTLPPSEQSEKGKWLAGIAQFVASSDFYEQVKESEAARLIRGLRCQLDEMTRSQPVIVRSSGINEDNYGDAQAGKYLSVVQEEDDVLLTCLKVMASGYRPEVCPGVIPPPMALIMQQCIDCQYGGVVMSFQSFQDDTIRVEYTPGQPRGAVAGQSGNMPHRIDIFRKKGADSSQYFPGTVSSCFILRKNKDNNGYSETRIDDADAQSDDGGQKLSDNTVSELRKVVTKLEDLLLCPVDVEFAIDHQGCLFVLQVRPITRLSGGMDFAMSMPEDSLAIGEAISEGYCTGLVWPAKKQKAGSIPQGAIVVAHHAEEWMLEPEFLERAGGFVLAEAGFNDHVAILMKQEGKTLMLAGKKYEAVAAQDGQQVTLACARFNGKPGAFIVVGDLTEKLASHTSLSPAFSDVPLVKAVPSRDDLSLPEETFCLVASGFQWLNDQNARLLALFTPGGGLDCLTSPIKLSMSPQRSELLAEIRDSVNRLVHGAEALLDGYGAYLRLADNNSVPQIQPMLDELPPLINRFGTLKQTIRSGLECIIQPLQVGKEGRVSFRGWLAACRELQSSLQALKPGEAEQVRSVHELIFALHQRFVNALAPLTLASGQGSISSEKHITYVDCTALSNPIEKAPLLRPSCKVSIAELGCSGTVVIMDDVLIVNLKLGSHVCLIELLECAEGGKERTLRLKFSDQFYISDGIDRKGKLKRMWFLVQLLRALELDKNSDSMKVSFNAVAGEILVECPRMSTTETMQEAFAKLITALSAMYNLDSYMDRIAVFEGDQWNFSLLTQRLNGDIATEAYRFAFQHCLFSMYYKKNIDSTPDCFKLLPNHKQFVNCAQRLAECRGKSVGSFREILMSNEIAEETRRDLLHHLLFLDAKNATPLVEDVYLDLRGQCYVVKPSSYSYRLSFDVPPEQSLSENKEKIKKSLLKHGLEYGSQRVLNDKDFVLPFIAARPINLKYASEELKDDEEVALTAITQCGVFLMYAGPKIKDNEEIVKFAIAHYPRALEYASERLRSDKNIIQMVIDDDIDNLNCASEIVLNDREYMLELIKQNPRAFEHVAPGLKHDETLIEAARQRNSEVRQYVRKSANKV